MKGKTSEASKQRELSKSFMSTGFKSWVAAGTAILSIAFIGVFLLVKPVHSPVASTSQPKTDDIRQETQITPQNIPSHPASEQLAGNPLLPPNEDKRPGDNSKPANKPTDGSNITPVCADKTNHLEKKYLQDVEKEKKSLDEQLSFPPVGANISTRYVQTFNDRLKEIYTTYVLTAQEDDCVFPVTEPDFLPLNYPG